MKKTSLIALWVLILIVIGIAYIAYTREAAPAPQVTANSTIYVCKNKKMIGAKFYTQVFPEPQASVDGKPPVPTGSVDVTLSDGRGMHLAQTISGSGVRYANKDESFIFWTKGTSVIILEDNEEKLFLDCQERVSALPGSASSTKIFFYDSKDFSLMLPRFTTPPQITRTDSYTVDESHSYGLIPGETIAGVKFTIPQAMSQGTNLSKDSYISVEHITNAKKCTGDMFLEGEHLVAKVVEKGLTYSVASTTGAAAGNRYEEIVYATGGKTMCLAVRYFIHYGVFENYPAGTVKEFNKKALIDTFNTIRTSITVKS